MTKMVIFSPTTTCWAVMSIRVFGSADLQSFNLNKSHMAVWEDMTNTKWSTIKMQHSIKFKYSRVRTITDKMAIKTRLSKTNNKITSMVWSFQRLNTISKWHTKRNSKLTVKTTNSHSRQRIQKETPSQLRVKSTIWMRVNGSKPNKERVRTTSRLVITNPRGLNKVKNQKLG